MEPKCSLPHSQQSTNYPHPEPDQLSPSPPSYFLKVHFNITSHLHTGLPSSLFPLGFPTSISSPNTCYMPRPFRFYWFDHSNNVWWRVQIMKLLHHLLQSTLTSSRLGPYIFRALSLSLSLSVSTPFLNILRLRSCLSKRDQVSHPYKNKQNYSCVFCNSYLYLKRNWTT